jgi:putative sporulation protein YyaC
MFKIRRSTQVETLSEVGGELHKIIPSSFNIEDVFFVCIGTDRSTGDSLGPLIGTMLEDLGYNNIMGTIDAPLHAVNLVQRLQDAPINKQIIAIDACLGRVSDIGSAKIIKGSLRPGAGVGKELPAVGNYGIKGIVNVGGFQEYAVLQNTRLKVVKDLAILITQGIQERFPLQEKEELSCPKDSKKTTYPSHSLTS